MKKVLLTTITSIMILSSCINGSDTNIKANKIIKNLENKSIILDNDIQKRQNNSSFEPYDKYCGKTYNFKLTGNKCLIIRKTTDKESENNKYTHFGNYKNLKNGDTGECYFNINELNGF